MATFVNYNGQNVENDDLYKSNVEEAAKLFNTATGQNLSTKDYDYRINPTTAGARWGDATTPSNYQLPADLTSAPSSGSANPSGGGLLNPSPAASPAPSVATYKPTKQTVNPNSLVQNQIAGITSQDSSLNQLARTDAMKSANSRGLLNSSLAVGSAQRAVLQQALPIAQQDAGTYASVDAANNQYQNAADQFNAGAQNTLSGINAQGNIQKDLQQMQSATQLSLADKDAVTKTALANLDAQMKMTLQTLDGQQKSDLQNTISKNQQLLQSNVSASNLATQYLTNLANISTNDKLDGPAKQQAIDNQTTALNQQLQVISDISGLNLGKYFVTSPNAIITAPPSGPGAGAQE